MCCSLAFLPADAIKVLTQQIRVSNGNSLPHPPTHPFYVLIHSSTGDTGQIPVSCMSGSVDSQKIHTFFLALAVSLPHLSVYLFSAGHMRVCYVPPYISPCHFKMKKIKKIKSTKINLLLETAPLKNILSGQEKK